ncbi:hypothetical protein Pmani_016063 [Petrolisthes manimaculis]|uniref:Uncharacterized protein n=1 Tax=Petrolisthes manimaculis TaxID=1843537 RepID=A0AAE1UAX2_9EUCA|nr:hypothetical protein Pmani_016063 [Petrolisthes manimaculis]
MGEGEVESVHGGLAVWWVLEWVLCVVDLFEGDIGVEGEKGGIDSSEGESGGGESGGGEGDGGDSSGGESGGGESGGGESSGGDSGGGDSSGGGGGVVMAFIGFQMMRGSGKVAAVGERSGLRAVHSLLDIQREKERAEMHPSRYLKDLEVLYNIHRYSFGCFGGGGGGGRNLAGIVLAALIKWRWCRLVGVGGSITKTRVVYQGLAPVPRDLQTRTIPGTSNDLLAPLRDNILVDNQGRFILTAT